MEEVKRKIIITESGQQIPVQAMGGVELSVFAPDDPVVEEVSIDVNDKEFNKIQKQAVTNKIRIDILKHKKDIHNDI